MVSTGSSFIDIAALDEVRSRFAAGDAIAILSAGLDEVIWANGPGAGLFGYADIEAIMGASAGLTLAQRRQIAATPGFPRIGGDRTVMLRLASGFGSRAVAMQASAIVLPDGEMAILLALPAPGAGGRSPDEIAQRAISGFGGDGHFAALIEADGALVAATDGFESLGIASSTLAALAKDAGTQADRVLKRLIPAGQALYPMGLARLSDDPALHILVVIDEDQAAQIDGTSGESLEQDTAVEGFAGTAAAELVAHMAETPEADEQAADPIVNKPASSAEPINDNDPEISESPTKVAPSGRDDWYFADRQPDVAQRPASPVRFVWRTDADGRFSALSAEFADAVGAADVIGRTFREVAERFGFDRSGDIASLLERRDTWSGRSVLWPIAGSGKRVPVDLAALPAYSRDRTFEGFRGFGVARMADLVDEPEPIATPAATPLEAKHDGPAATAEAGDAPADPFQGETPALTVEPTPKRRLSDKIIRLAEHRPGPPAKTLSPVERIAFREIGDRLKQIAEPSDETEADGQATDEETTKDSREAPETVHAEAEPAATDKLAADAEPSTPEHVIADDDAGGPSPEEAGEPVADEGTAPSDVAPGGEIAADEGEPYPPEQPLEAHSRAVDEPERPEPDRPASPEPSGDDSSPGRPVTSTSIWARAAGLPAERAAAPESPAADAQSDDTQSPAAFVPSAFAQPAAANAGEEGADQDFAILSRLPVPLLIHSGDVLHFANREFLSLTGYPSLEELDAAGGLGALIAGPYDGENGVDPDRRMLRIRMRSGDEFAAEGHLQSVPWKSGKALLLALRTAEPIEAADDGFDARIEEMEARAAEMQAIVDTATDGLVLIANDGTIRSISRPAEALFGFDSSDIAGKPFQSLFAVESQRAARDYLNGLSDNGVASVLNDGREVIGREAQGRFIPLFMTIGRLPDQSGYCAVLRDITQWKRAEEELTQARAQAERASSHKTEFLARISHEIRTPLNAIIGFSELMIDEKFGPIGNDRYRDYLRDINRSGNHVLDLVNDLLDISKIEAGEQEMAYEAVSLNDTLSETVALMQPQANRDRVIIRSSFSARLPEVVADLRSIRQIALNLLSNAIRYTQAGGQVIVSTAYESSGDVVMRVRDTGIGMTHAEIEQALKPFKQINALKRARGDGTGLGLPLTKAMVEANRAKFTINSTPGEGTMVEIVFPSTRVLAG